MQSGPHISSTTAVHEWWGISCDTASDLVSEKVANHGTTHLSCDKTCKLNNNKRACQSAKADHSAMCKHRGKGFDYLGEGQGNSEFIHIFLS